MTGNINFSAIYRPRKAYEAEPFDSSAINFTKFAELITRILSTFDQGFVLALDGPWGCGKSFFGANFSAQLKNSGWQTAYVDAFAHDYVEDPFLLIVSTIIADIAAPKHGRNLLKAASRVGKVLLPLAAKAAVRIGTFAGISTDDLDEVRKAATDAGGEAAEKLTTKKLEDFQNERASIEDFRKRLADLSEKVKQESDHPLVVFIDELDRCQPAFAVRTLERIKHFFDVQHVSFVLLVNRKQLEAAVSGMYGATIDADIYLRKFIQFDIPFPLRQRTHDGVQAHVASFVDFLGSKVSLGEQSESFRSFIGTMRQLGPAFDFSMRDVERAFTLFVSASAGRKFAPQLVDLLAFVIALRVAAPSVYRGVVEKTNEGYEGANRVLQSATKKGLKEHYARVCMDMVVAHVRGADKVGQDSPIMRGAFSQFNLEVANLFIFFAEMVDQVTIR